jgi:hypothetical protein
LQRDIEISRFVGRTVPFGFLLEGHAFGCRTRLLAEILYISSPALRDFAGTQPAGDITIISVACFCTIFSLPKEDGSQG